MTFLDLFVIIAISFREYVGEKSMFELLLRELLKGGFTESDIELIKKAHDYACLKHAGIFRDSGEPYITHPEHVAYILYSDLHLRDVNSLCAALLHDTIEDTDTTYEDLVNLFNKDIANLVLGVTNIKNINFANKTEKEIANIVSLLKAAMRDYRVISIRVADRLHNMLTISTKKGPAKRKAKSIETLQVIAPIADKIGAYEAKRKLEDLAFEQISPRKFAFMKDQLEQYELRHLQELEDIFTTVNTDLSKNGIYTDMRIRYKNIYAICKELKRKQKLASIHDLIFYQVETENTEDCYKALMLIHQRYKALNAGFFRDYISSAKPNGYQALHTTVNGFTNHLVQFQICTKKMALLNKYGFAVLKDLYKNKTQEEIQAYLIQNDSFMRSLDDIDRLHLSKNEELYKQFSDEIFKEQVEVSSRDGILYNLPKGATVLDFAYKIHSEIGDKATKAIVNNKEVPITYVLKNGDNVRVLVDENQICQNEDALNYVVTGTAKRAIKESLSRKEKGITKTRTK